MPEESGDLDVKIKDVINEAESTIGTRAARDITGTDYEKDPETGELSGRREPSPTFGSMLQDVMAKHTADSGSMFYQAKNTPKEKIDTTKVPPGIVLVTTTRHGRKYYKFSPEDSKGTALTIPSGVWKDESGRVIYNQQSVISLENLAKKNGKFIRLQDALSPETPDSPDSTIVMPGDPGDEPVGEPSVSEPLHPDVSIVQSVPLVMQYKGKRFEMDDYGEFHPFGTTRPVTAALQTFLTKERSKL